MLLFTYILAHCDFTHIDGTCHSDVGVSPACLHFGWAVDLLLQGDNNLSMKFFGNANVMKMISS